MQFAHNISKIINCLFLLFSGCTYIFETGSDLANFQQEKFNDFENNKKIIKEELHRLENNMWIWTAEALAPGNLVIRQLVLIDLYNNRTDYYSNIILQLKVLGGNGLYLEGYSYFCYIKPFLVKYAEVFKLSDIQYYVEEMDMKFLQTAYIGSNSKPHPAPFGDLRNIGLELHLSDTNKIAKNIEIHPIEKKTGATIIVYHIKPCPVGLNAHIPKEKSLVKITNGIPYLITDGIVRDYPWYTGWENKYDSKIQEHLDTFDYRRVNTITVHRWWKRLGKLLDEVKND